MITGIIFQETYLMHTFNEDFYGSKLKVVMLGYIRPMKDFSSLGNILNIYLKHVLLVVHR